MSDPLVISVILNTNRRADTLECLASLQHNTYTNQRALVLDNHSRDGSVDAIRAAFPNAQVIELAENRGYAGNNNVGIEIAMAQNADWIFVLNEDTILDPDCLARLVALGESDSQIGMVGPLVYHHDEPTVIQSAGGFMNRDWEAGHLGKDENDQGQFNAPRAVEWITGCSILVRRAVIDQVGALDDRFFIYFEETEWCVRARTRGWRLMIEPRAKVWHKGVQRNYKPKPAFTYYSARNRFLMLAKHRAPIRAWLVAWTQTLRTLASWTLKPKWRHLREHRDALWHCTLDFLRGRTGMRAG